jgi:hypothetical protein
MRATRREVLRVLAQTAAFYGLGGAAAGAAGESNPAASFEGTLATYLNTLIPDDESSPGAVQLGVYEHMSSAAKTNARFRNFLEQGTRWFNAEAQKLGSEDFAGLSEDGRNQVVAAAEAAGLNTLENKFFRATRLATFKLYYMEPQAWPAIGFDGPPQPIGFPDYADPPAGGD